MRIRIPAWSFPRHRPQMYSPDAAGLVRVHRYYAFGRAIPAPSRLALTGALAVPGIRRLVSGRDDLEIPFDVATFERFLEWISSVVEHRTWAAFQSAWHTESLIVFSFDRTSRCSGVTHISPQGDSVFHPSVTGVTVNVPRVLGTGIIEGWSLATVESVPPWHQPHPWDPDRLEAVLTDVRAIVGKEVAPPDGVDAGLVPAHGDLTPWNLRLDSIQRPWLFDWEWAGWAPRGSDLLRFAIAHRSLQTTDPAELATWVSANVPSDALGTAARYWLGHRIYRDGEARLNAEQDLALVSERQQGQVEAAALRILAGAAD